MSETTLRQLFEPLSDTELADKQAHFEKELASDTISQPSRVVSNLALKVIRELLKQRELNN